MAPGKQRTIAYITAAVLLLITVLSTSGPAVMATPDDQGTPGVTPVSEISLQQDVGNRGREFWLAFPENYSAFDADPTTLSLFITGESATIGNVEVPGIFSQAFAVAPGEITTIEIPIEAQLTGAGNVENKGIHVTASDTIIVYGLSQQQFTTDAYLALPVPSLGTEYIVLSYESQGRNDRSQYAVVASEDNTNVTIIAPDGTSSNIVLNRGQAYQNGISTAGADVSGTVITADKPVSVFGSNRCANVPPDFGTCDILLEQLPPTASWGQQFATVSLATRTLGDTFRFLAAVDGTEVRVNGEVVANLNRAEFHEQLIDGNAFITATQPILVAQYSNGSDFDDVDNTDPFMMLIPPVEQFFSVYTVSTPATGFVQNFINIVAPNSAVGNIVLDGSTISASAFTPIGDTGFSAAQVEVGLGTHNLFGSEPFGVFSYGYNVDDSYGYAGGQNAALIGGVLVSPVTLNLFEGNSGAYQVVLSRRPTSDVIVNITSDAAQVSLDRSSLTFTPDNWDIPQTVIVTAVEDDVDEGTQSTVITHDAVSDDASYATVDVASVLVNICAVSRDNLDVVFLIDTTSSMSGVIDTVQAEVSQIAGQLQASVPNTAFGLATFSDYPGIYGVSGDVPYAVQQTLTTDIALFETAVNNITLNKGGDRAEAYGRALDEVVNFNWRENAQRVVVLVGDADPHTERTVYGDGRPDPGPDGIVGTSDDIDFVDAINRTRVNEITVVGLLASTSSTTIKAARFFDFVTEGKYERIPGTPDSLLPSILAVVTTAVCTPADASRAIVLERFTATPVTSGIEVRWVTSSEINTWGFHLLRSADGTRESAERITPELIPAEGRGQAGASYTWLDTDVEPGITYTYWLEETETDGTVIEYGTSVWSQPGTNATNHSIHLPIIIR